jgi:hypothetical protein
MRRPGPPECLRRSGIRVLPSLHAACSDSGAAFWAASSGRPGAGRDVRTDVPQAIRGTRRGSPGRITPVLGSSPVRCDCPTVAHSGIVPRLGHGSHGYLRVPRRVRIPAEDEARLAPGLGRGATDARLLEGTLEGALDPRPDPTPPNIAVSISEILPFYS